MVRALLVAGNQTAAVARLLWIVLMIPENGAGDERGKRLRPQGDREEW